MSQRRAQPRSRLRRARPVEARERQKLVLTEREAEPARIEPGLPIARRGRAVGGCLVDDIVKPVITDDDGAMMPRIRDDVCVIVLARRRWDKSARPM